jgi:DNA-binding transcriptional regulator LsrR (DeoR family)
VETVTEPSQRQFAGPGELVAAARVARRYYFDRRSKVQIAGELGVTRFKVARLLEIARATGLVRITVTGTGTLDLDLSHALGERFGLRHAVVVNTSRGNDAEMRQQIGKVAADLLDEITTPNDVLGLGWARVVLAMAASLRDLKAQRIVQLTGALTRPDVEPSSVEMVRNVARAAQAKSSVFYAPMIVSDVETAQALLRQDQIADAVARFDTVTKAVVGVGGWNPPNSTLHDALTPAERDLMRTSGVHADLSGVLLDANGDAVETPLSGRLVAITAEQLRRVPEVIGIAYGPDKVSAAHAAIRGGYLKGLVTHTEFAQQLLAESA